MTKSNYKGPRKNVRINAGTAGNYPEHGRGMTAFWKTTPRFFDLGKPDTFLGPRLLRYSYLADGVDRK